MTLSFLMITQNGGAGLWARCGALATVTVPGDEVLLYDTGESKDGAQLLRRFDQEVGWGEGVVSRLVARSDICSEPVGGWAALRALSDHKSVLVLQDEARPTFDGIKMLRRLLETNAPELVLINSAWMLASPASVLPCPDVARWPETGVQEGKAAHEAALRLMPHPVRLFPTGDLPCAEYETAVKGATRIGFVSTPVLLSPLPEPLDPTSQISELDAWLAAAPYQSAPETLTCVLLQLDDLLMLLDPSYTEHFLDALRRFIDGLPRRLRRLALTYEGPIGAILSDLKRGDGASAIARLGLQFSAQDRARVGALTGEISQLRADLDLALPGPEYLMDLFQRTRRA